MKYSSWLFTQRLTVYSCSLVFVLWFFVGCTSSQGQANTFTATPATTAEMIPSVPPATTATAVPPTNTSTSTQAPSPSPTNTPLPPTLTPTPSRTPTPVPTLTVEEEGELIQELMATNGGCQLPCWWGIELGDTLVSVSDTFANWGAAPWRVTTSWPYKGYINLGYYEPNSSFDSVSVFLEFYALDGIVQYIKTSGSHESRQFGEQEFVRDWEKYFLPTFLQTFGRPSLAYLRPGNIADPGPSNYTLLLYYPDLGINVSYNFFGTQLSDGRDEVCFALENVMLLQLSLYNPEFAENWPVAQLLGLGSSGEDWLIENQMGIDLDTFYETYQDPDNLGCIQLTR